MPKKPKRWGFAVTVSRDGYVLVCDYKQCHWQSEPIPHALLSDLERAADTHGHVGPPRSTPERLRDRDTDGSRQEALPMNSLANA